MNLFETINKAVDPLFEAEDRRLEKAIDRLVTDHREASGRPETGFMYNGLYYRHSNTTQIERLPMLAFSLNDRMERFLKDQKKVHLDKELVSQLLFRVLQADNDQAIRNRMPDVLVPLFPFLKGLERTEPVEEAFKNEPRTLRRFHKMEPVINVYAMARMIF